MDFDDYFEQEISKNINNDLYKDCDIFINNNQDLFDTEEMDLNEFDCNSKNKEEKEIKEIKDKKKDEKKNNSKNLTNNKCFFHLYKYTVINNSETSDNNNIKKQIKNTIEYSIFNKENSNCNEFTKPLSIFSNCNNISLTKVKNLYFINKTKKTHDSNSIDNKIRTIKSFMIELLIIYANILIKAHEKDDNGKKIKKQFILKIEGKIANNTNVEYNKVLMKTKIKEILISKITKRIKNYKRVHNKKVIEKYYENNYVRKIVSFLDCEFQESFIYLKDKINENFKGLEIIYLKQLQLKKKVKIKKIIEENILDFVKTINKRKERKKKK